MELIYHVTTQAEWEKAQKDGFYKAGSLAIEGFIHCSTAHQIEGVLERYFAGKTNLVKLNINPNKLTSKLVYELSPSINQEFPHVFGVINLDAIIQSEKIR